MVSIFRIIYISSADLETNLTGTLPLSIFVSQIEPLLAIICVSIPMLGPIYKRYRRHNGSSRLYDMRGSSGLPSGPSSSKNRRHWEMDTMQTTAAAGRHDSDSQSYDAASSDRDLGRAAAPHGITVQTQYTVTRD